MGLCSSHRTPEPARGAGEGEGLGLAPPRAGPGLGGGAVLLSPRFLLPYPLVSLPRSGTFALDVGLRAGAEDADTLCLETCGCFARLNSAFL